MSYLTYNDITFDLTKTIDFRQSFETDPTNTDIICTRFDLVVQGVYNPKAMSYTTAEDGSPIAAEGYVGAQTDAAIRHALSEHRKYLEYGVAVPDPANPGEYVNFPILASPPLDQFGDPESPSLAPCDAKNGPMPFLVDVKMKGEKTWIIEFGIRTWLNECPGPLSLGDDGGPGDLLLSNRFSRVHQVDIRDLTRIITTGTSIFRLDALLSQPNPMNQADFFRRYCLPGIPPTFQRQSININVGADGSRLDWSVVDMQKMNSGTQGSDYIKYGVKNVQGRFTESTISAGQTNLPGPFVHLNVDIQVDGGMNSSSASLEAFAVKLALQKFGLSAAGITDPRTQGTVTEARIGEAIGDHRSISLHMSMRVPIANGGAGGLGMLRFDLLGMDNPSVFGADGTYQIQPPGDQGTRGTYDHLAFADALRTACSAPTKPSGPKGDGAGDSDAIIIDESAPNVSVTAGDDLPGYPNLVIPFPSPGQGQFEEYQCATEYFCNSNTMMAPIAGADGTDADGNPKPTASFMTLALPTATATTVVHAIRVGDAPILPKPVSSDRNFVLLRYFPKNYAGTVSPADGQTMLYRGEMTIEWGMKRPPDPNSDTGPPIPTMPWVGKPFGSASPYYSNGVIDPPAGSEGRYPPSPGLLGGGNDSGG